MRIMHVHSIPHLYHVTIVMVNFGYTYKFEINGTTFKAIGTNNNSATAITIVED